ncbi:MAG: DUF6691 family protein [Bacteriovoracia bacterium]
MKLLISFIVGMIFALGLGVSGMTQTHLVRGFLDVFGNWNPALIGVMAGAIAVHSVFYLMIKKRSSPLLDTKFHIPTRKDIDARLLAGAALFGIGWGWAGICPGPGIVAAASGLQNIIIFVGSMLVGMAIFKVVDHKFMTKS